MSPDILAMPAASQDLYGKTAGEMVSGMMVYEDGSEKMSFVKNEVPAKQDIPWEEKNVLRVTKEDTFTIQVDGEDVCTLNFKKAKFEPKE